MLTSSWVLVGSSQVINLGFKVFKLEELKVLEFQKVYFKIETKVPWIFLKKIGTKNSFWNQESKNTSFNFQ